MFKIIYTLYRSKQKDPGHLSPAHPALGTPGQYGGDPAYFQSHCILSSLHNSVTVELIKASKKIVLQYPP